jgi:hypothetical protein
MACGPHPKGRRRRRPFSFANGVGSRLRSVVVAAVEVEAIVVEVVGR